jgi:hypothetical protein
MAAVEDVIFLSVLISPALKDMFVSIQLHG